MADATWPARMQRLKSGNLVDSVPSLELWLDGGHNASAALAISDLLDTLPKRETHLICGMLNTKDVSGYMKPLAQHVHALQTVSIPGETNTLPSDVTAKAARDAGMTAHEADSIDSALKAIFKASPNARVLICGSLYLAGHVLRENG
jgi:dihydrofolate synthase/folylpolyglutamate synthase